MSQFQIVLAILVGLGVVLLLVGAFVHGAHGSTERHAVSYREGYHGSKYVGSQYDGGADMRRLIALETERKLIGKRK